MLFYVLRVGSGSVALSAAFFPVPTEHAYSGFGTLGRGGGGWREGEGARVKPAFISLQSVNSEVSFSLLYCVHLFCMGFHKRHYLETQPCGSGVALCDAARVARVFGLKVAQSGQS